MVINISTDYKSEHVPELNQHIRLLNKHICACHHTLPLKYISKTILVDMVNNVLLCLNDFPFKVGVSNIVRRCDIITGINIDFN